MYGLSAASLLTTSDFWIVESPFSSELSMFKISLHCSRVPLLGRICGTTSCFKWQYRHELPILQLLSRRKRHGLH